MSYAETLAMTRAGEDLGYEAALLAEHYYPTGIADMYAGGPGERDTGDAWIYLAALARETSRIRLGTLVSPVTFRHPSVLAKMAATLDHVSDGRAELGIGAGWFEHEHSAYGFDFPACRPPRRPGRRAAPGHHRPVEPGSVQPLRQGLPVARLPLHAQTDSAAASDDPGRRPLHRRAPPEAGRQVRRRVRLQYALDRPGPRDPRAARPRVRGEWPRPGHAAAGGVPGHQRRHDRTRSPAEPGRVPGDQPAVRAHAGQSRELDQRHARTSPGPTRRPRRRRHRPRPDLSEQRPASRNAAALVAR